MQMQRVRRLCNNGHELESICWREQTSGARRCWGKASVAKGTGKRIGKGNCAEDCSFPEVDPVGGWMAATGCCWLRRRGPRQEAGSSVLVVIAVGSSDGGAAGRESGQALVAYKPATRKPAILAVPVNPRRGLQLGLGRKAMARMEL